LLEGLMRIQDKIKGYKMNKQRSEANRFGVAGEKLADELPVPHHSGYVAAPHDQDPLYDHQKITG
jgi:NADH-quinone oxidoreductase subunit B